MDASMKFFLLGAAGALAPEIVRLYTLATGGDRLTWSPGFYIGTSVLIALLGGLIAVILPSENLQSAFYAGIGTPGLITAVARKARQSQVSGSQASDASADPNKSFAPRGPAASSPRRLSRVDAFIQAL